MGSIKSDMVGTAGTDAELRAQRTLEAAKRLMAPTGQASAPSVEHELREYMQELRLKADGRARSLASRVGGKI